LDDAGVAAVRDVITSTGAAAAVERLIDERAVAALAALDRTAMADDARAELAALATLATQRVH
ncbi:MAG: hypothetical protein QOD07_705, partial [Frankiaceae bacterium]|nr:hypothetical protein [Frankiaceae bacterium]